MTRKEALRLRAIVVQAAASLDDQTASAGAALFPRLKQDGALVKSGTRINWNGTLKRAAVDLWDTEANNPDNAPHALGGHRLPGRLPGHPADHHGRHGLCHG